MFALLLCVPLLTLQGGGLALPQSLAEQPEATAAWATLSDSKSEAGAKSAAGAVLLEQLSALPPAAQLPFLMEAEGLGLMPMSLRATYRNLAIVWPALEARILETLVLPAGQNDALLLGAIHAAGDLATSNAAMLEQLASLLEAPAFRADARRALYQLTRKEFSSQEVFLDWWATAKERGRESWLEEAAESSARRELDDWRRRLQAGGQPAEILAGVIHPRQQIRSMAYVALRSLDFAGLDAETRGQVAIALRSALQQESDALLRIELLALVPQVLQDREALNPLLHSLQYGVPEEQVAAARYLQLLEPEEIAWEGILRGLEGAYPASVEGPSGPVPVRMALWSGLGTLILRGAAPNPETLEQQMNAALSVETDRAVRGHILSAVGRFGRPSFLEVLRPIVTDVEADEADRSDALVAMTGIVEHMQDPGQLLPLLTDLLDDHKPLVRRRAIESLRRLKFAEGPMLLVQRLPLESEVVLQKEILSALAEKQVAGIVAPLAAFDPAPPLREAYGRALVAQVGSDFETLKTVNQAMAQRGDVDFAFQIVRGFPTDGLDEAQVKEKERLYAVAVSERLLVVGVDNGNSSFADDAVALLQGLNSAEPQSLEWPVYLVELQLMRGEVAPALTVMQELALRNDMALSRRWELGLDTLRFAASANLIEPGRTLLETLVAAGEIPPEMQDALDQVAANFPSPEPEAVLPPKTTENQKTGEEASAGEKPAPGDQPQPIKEGGEPKAGGDPGATAEAGKKELPKMVAEPL